MSWAIFIDDEGAKQVVPLNDLTDHYLCEECPCGPRFNEDSNWIHNSLDGREFEEPDYEGPPMPKE